MKKTIKKNIDNKLPIYKLTSKKKVLEYDDDWTNNAQFNQDMVDWKYTAPSNAAKLLHKYSPNKDIQILDAGCGSGLVGMELAKNGYINITGVDFSQSMMDLIPKNIYKSLKLIDLNETLFYKENSFDAIICVGTFTYGHVKARALDEFLRITKNNGLICFTVNEGIYNKYKFDKKITELSKNNSWKILELSKSAYIVNKDVHAWLCIAKVNKN
jgi:ubiquinone/menaquinone biosynthesis C-methylase UbiE